MTDLNNTDQFDTGHAKGNSDDIMSSFLTEDEIRSWKQDLSSDTWKIETDSAAASAADGFGDISDFFKNEDHPDSYAGFQDTQGLKESHSAFDDGESTGGTVMDSFRGKEAGLTTDRDLINEFVQESVAKDQSITRVQDARVSEYNVYATDDRVAEDEVIASDDRVSEDDVYATDESVAEDVVYATDQDIREEEIAPDQDISYTYTTPDPRKGSSGQSSDPASNKEGIDGQLVGYIFAIFIFLLYFFLR